VCRIHAGGIRWKPCSAFAERAKAVKQIGASFSGILIFTDINILYIYESGHAAAYLVLFLFPENKPSNRRNDQ